MSAILPHTVWPQWEFRVQVWNTLHAARWNTGRKKSPKIRHLFTIAQLCRAISSQLRHAWTMGKNLLSSNTSPTWLRNTVRFGPLTAEIRWLVWGTPANFNGFRVLAVLLHVTLVVGVSQTLRRWKEVATYIRQGGHHAGHGPTFSLVLFTWMCIICAFYCIDGICPFLYCLFFVYDTNTSSSERPRDTRVTSIGKIAKWNFWATLFWGGLGET